MKEYLLKLDLISPKPKMLIEGHNRYRTILGCIASLIAYILILVTTIYFTINLFYRTSKIITYNLYPTEDALFNISQSPYQVLITDRKGYPLKNQSRYFTFLTYHWNIVKYYNNTQYTEQIYIPSEACNLNNSFGEKQKLFEMVPYIEQHYCRVPGADIQINGAFGQVRNFSILTHFLLKCKNNTSINKTYCYSDEVIASYLYDINFNFKFLEYRLNHSNVENPGSLYLRSDVLPMSSSVVRKSFYSIRPITYTSDIGYIWEEKVTNNYFSYSDYKESTNINNNDPDGLFAYVQLQMDSKFDDYQRTYMKAQTLLANIGGIVKGIMVIFNFLLGFITEEMYNLELISSLFNIQEEKINKRRSQIEVNAEKPLNFAMTFKRAYSTVIIV